MHLPSSDTVTLYWTIHCCDHTRCNTVAASHRGRPEPLRIYMIKLQSSGLNNKQVGTTRLCNFVVLTDHQLNTYKAIYTAASLL